MWERCESMGRTLAASVLEVWHRSETAEELEIDTRKHTYALELAASSSGVRLLDGTRTSELGLLVLDGVHAFLAVPGELSTLYDADIKRFGGWLGFAHTSILGLTNDAHAYIITPESWRHRTYESTVSFGGETYGERVKSMAHALLHELEPAGAHQAERALPSALLDPGP